VGVAVQVELALRHRGCVSEGFHGATTMAQLSGDRRAEARSDLFLLHAETPRKLDEALKACEEYVHSRADVIDRRPTSVVFRGINSPGGAVSAIRASPCTILWPIVYRDGLEYYRLLAPDRPALTRLVEALRPYGEVRLRSVAEAYADTLEATVPLVELTRGLTRTQLEVFLLARLGGYYDTPRRATTAQLAHQRGLSESTFAEHLRKAERVLLQEVGALVQDFEVLARGATKGKGRPPRVR